MYVIFSVVSELLTILDMVSVPLLTLLVTVQCHMAALTHLMVQGAQEGGAVGAHPGEHHHVRLKLGQVPFEKHLGNVGQLKTSTQVLVQGILTLE